LALLPHPLLIVVVVVVVVVVVFTFLFMIPSLIVISTVITWTEDAVPQNSLGPTQPGSAVLGDY